MFWSSSAVLLVADSTCAASNTPICAGDKRANGIFHFEQLCLGSNCQHALLGSEIPGFDPGLSGIFLWTVDYTYFRYLIFCGSGGFVAYSSKLGWLIQLFNSWGPMHSWNADSASKVQWSLHAQSWLCWCTSCMPCEKFLVDPILTIQRSNYRTRRFIALKLGLRLQPFSKHIVCQLNGLAPEGIQSFNTWNICVMYKQPIQFLGIYVNTVQSAHTEIKQWCSSSA